MNGQENICALNCNIRKYKLFDKCLADSKSENVEGDGILCFSKDQYIFRHGDKPTGVYCLKEGKVFVYQQMKNNKLMIIKLAREGDILGYRALLEDGLQSLSAKTVSDCKICFVNKKRFNKFLNNDPEFRLKMIQFLSDEFTHISSRMHLLTEKSDMGKIASCLLWVSKIYCPDYDKSNELTFVSTVSDIGAMSGLSDKLVNGIIDELNCLKIIHYSNHQCRILSLKRLSEISNEKVMV